MIKCYFVEVKNIISNLPKSNFRESEIEKLADLILATDGLVRPLILRDTGGEKYTVIEGDLEYYAAVRAKEKNLFKAEEVNAFIVSAELQKSATDQLTLLAGDRQSNVSASKVVDLSLEQLLTTLSSAISPQLQPIIDRLNQHKNILDTLEKRQIDPKISPTIAEQLQMISDRLAEHKEILDLLVKKPDVKPEDYTLNLINTLSENDLIQRMEESNISKSIIKLIPNIIARRNIQPTQNFHDWKFIKKEVNGLGDAMIKKIIEKLK